MNFRQLLTRLFTGNATRTEIDSASQAGEEDGRAVANAYCDGVFKGVFDVFEERLSGFQSIDVMPIELVERPRVAAKRARVTHTKNTKATK